VVLLFSICKELTDIVCISEVGLWRLERGGIDSRARMDVRLAARDLTLELRMRLIVRTNDAE
jgi:hypothetical protein